MPQKARLLIHSIINSRKERSFLSFCKMPFFFFSFWSGMVLISVPKACEQLWELRSLLC